MQRRLTRFALFVTLALPAAAQTIDGAVINSLDGKPIPGVEISLYANGRGKPARELLTDAAGAFRVESLDPGDYSLVFTRKGFDGPGRGDSASRLFHLDPGGWIHIAASMTPRAKLSGRVLTPSGDPVPGARVWLVAGRENYEDETDPDGRFAIEAVAPGSYRIMTQPPRGLKPPPPHNEQPMGWVATYYPDTADANSAPRVTVAAGADLPGQEIRLAAVPVHHLRGVVRDLSGPAARVAVTVEPSNSPLHDASDRRQSSATDAEGRFDFPGLPDGEWRLAAESTRDAVRLRASARETISGGDRENLRLDLEPPFALTVRTVQEPPLPAAQPRMPTVVLHSDRINEIHFAMPGVDDDNRIPALYPGSYTVGAMPPAPGYYLASVRLGEREVLGSDPMEILSGALPLTVTWRAGGGTVRGTVEDCRGARVILVPEEPRLRIPELMPNTACNGTRFEFTAVRPGDYYILAFDPPNLSLDQLPTATRLTVRPAESTAVALRVPAR